MFSKLNIIVLFGLLVTMALAHPLDPFGNDEGDSDQDYNEGDNDEEAFDDNDGDQNEEGEGDLDRFKRQTSGCRVLTKSCSIDRDCCSGFCFRGKPGNQVFGACK